MRKILAAVATAMAVAWGSPALAQTNTNTITQNGVWNQDSTTQVGTSNTQKLKQFGGVNESTVYQSGHKNKIHSVQIGSSNDSATTQIGGTSKATIIQIGPNNTADPMQDPDGKLILIQKSPPGMSKK